MDVFLSLFFNILPLYAIIALGWLAGRFYEVEKESLAGLAIFIIVPIVSFYFIAHLDFQPSFILVPLVFFGLFTSLTFLSYWVGKKLYPDKRANLFAMCSGSLNGGYMGVPVVISLFPPEWAGVYVFGIAGGLIYEATVFYYVANRGNFDPKESVMRVLRFPVLYAIFLGLVVNLSGFSLPKQLDSFWEYFTGAYVVIGMMIIGVSLSRVTKLVISAKFLSFVFFIQFVVWPLTVLGLVLLDKNLTRLFAPEVHQLLFVLSVMPPAANTTAFAAKLNLNPEKAATTVLLGTLFALFYIPAALWLYGL